MPSRIPDHVVGLLSVVIRKHNDAEALYICAGAEHVGKQARKEQEEGGSNQKLQSKPQPG
jgi:hypothetical protein